MITHGGVRYWTTDELAASLMARGLIAWGGTKRNTRRRTRHWAEGADLRPAATTKRGAYLWAEDAILGVLDIDLFAK